jgi:hypothetical protein
MPSTIEKFDSAGGFSVEKTVHIDELHNASNFNSLEIKNSFFTDSRVANYILRGLSTSTLSLDDVGTLVPVDTNTLNFITGRIVATNPLGLVFSAKFESTASADATGNVTVLSTMKTIIKDDIPEGQEWNITPLGSQNKFSYNTVISGTTNVIKWAVSTEIISIEWQ